MGPLFLFTAGAAIALYSLWRLRRWLEAGPVASRHERAVRPVTPSPPAARREPASPEEGRRLAAVEREVARLAQAGLTVTEIARRVGLTRAEVQLILELRSRR